MVAKEMGKGEQGEQNSRTEHWHSIELVDLSEDLCAMQWHHLFRCSASSLQIETAWVRVQIRANIHSSRCMVTI